MEFPQDKGSIVQSVEEACLGKILESLAAHLQTKAAITAADSSLSHLVL